ncbi:MAG TPA: hypothetical protein VFM93_04005, partial [Candidatus Limnocylindria bacterium]|nr:hypothetical protein [Candidatus Limnocylindria bacterium]
MVFVLVLVLVFGPMLLPAPARTAYEPWRLTMLAVFGWLVYWYKHPGEHVRAAAVGLLIWAGFNAENIVPGLAEYEAEQEAMGAYEDYGDEEGGVTRLSNMLGIPVLIYALVVASDSDRKSLGRSSAYEPPGGQYADTDGDGSP